MAIDKAEVRALSKELRSIEKTKGIPRLGTMSHHTPHTIEKWQRELRTDPTVALVEKVKAALKQSDSKAVEVGSGDIVRRDPRTGEIARVEATYTNYEAVRPPREADGYRIFGVSRKGEIVASTVETGSWESAVAAFDKSVRGAKKHDSWDTVVAIIIQLIDDAD